MKIFLSYRRKDLLAVGTMNALFTRFAAEYGAENVFMDVDSVPLGHDFRKVLVEKVSQADVVVAVIGPQWAELLEEKKLASNDYVRVEIESALEQNIPVVPLLIGDTGMPKVSQLPDSISQLAYCHGFKIDPRKRFESDVAQLLSELNRNYDRNKPLSNSTTIESTLPNELPSDHWKGIPAATMILLLAIVASCITLPSRTHSLSATVSLSAALLSLAWIIGKYHISLVPPSEVGHLPFSRFVARIVVNIALLAGLCALGIHLNIFELTSDPTKRLLTIFFIAYTAVTIILMLGSYVEVFWYPGREFDMRGLTFKKLLLPILFCSPVMCLILSGGIAGMMLWTSTK